MAGLESIVLKLADEYNRPYVCEKCGGMMIFKGVGEYECEHCKHLAYDDYGIVRNYIENNKQSTAYEIEQITGVSQKSIRNMLKEGRLEISSGSSTFLHCEVCGIAIRSGRMCPKCEADAHRLAEEQARIKHLQNTNMKGVGDMKKGDGGAKRFNRP